jgi:hypothetical protein
LPPGLWFEPEYSTSQPYVVSERFDEVCTPADQADPGIICRLIKYNFGDSVVPITRTLYIMVSSTSPLDAGDIQLTIAPVSSKTNCPPLGGVQGVVFQDARNYNGYITCLYPFGTGTRSQAVAKCASFTGAGATLPWPRARGLGSLSTPHSNAMSLIARIVDMGPSDRVWMLGSRTEMCSDDDCGLGYTGGWTADDSRAASLACDHNGRGCPPWLPDQPST